MITDKNITEYAIKFSTPEDDVLQRLYRETHLTTVYPNMLSGPLQGRLLEFISRMMKPLRILEIGTFTGYSAIFLARGLAPGGVLHTIDINDELSETANRYFKEAGVDHSVVLHVGDALDIIPGINEAFDLVFIDADKEEYIRYYELVFPKVKPGGFILVDNVLWGGKVLPDNRDSDKETMSIREFNNLVLNDSRVEKLMLPFRDGIYLLYKLQE
ncbi:MAG TPA: O-methyltransferase [Bacteroidales bacterium]|jgi:predicted O-methyltransferase YrrM|nr:O-methyltransferase [Bacteroidales bacterium]